MKLMLRRKGLKRQMTSKDGILYHVSSEMKAARYRDRLLEREVKLMFQRVLSTGSDKILQNQQLRDAGFTPTQSCSEASS
jgi:hypothetical protein